MQNDTAIEELPEVPLFLSEGSTAKELRAQTPERSIDAPMTQAPSSPSKREAPSLASSLKKNKVTGKGIEMLEKIAFLFDEDMQEDMSTDKVGFLQVRLAAPKTRKITKKPIRPKDGVKNLSFNACPPDVQKGLLKTRAAEWRKWKDFNAGVILSRDEVSRLQDEGVRVYPMQWVETDKNAHKRRDNITVQMELKSRLVGCGNFEA